MKEEEKDPQLCLKCGSENLETHPLKEKDEYGFDQEIQICKECGFRQMHYSRTLEE